MLKEYFQLEFDLAAADQPAIYRMELTDRIQLLLFEVL